MIKQIVLLLHIVGLFFYNLFLSQDVTVIQNIPANVAPNEEVIVSLTINKDDITGFAKIEQLLPVGFFASPIEVEGATFSFKDQKVKIIWMSLPEESEFTIHYKLKAPQDLNKKFTIRGKFSFIFNNEPKTIQIPKKHITISEGLISQTDKSSLSDNAIEEKESSSKEGKIGVIKEKNRVIKEQKKEAVQEVKRSRRQSKTLTKSRVESTLASKAAISYRVQVAALRKKNSINVLSRKLNISQPIDMEFHDGWNKYIVGSYSIYKIAREGRNKVRNKVEKAFVTAYNQGKRITVQEALMISNQKWHQ